MVRLADTRSSSLTLGPPSQRQVASRRECSTVGIRYLEQGHFGLVREALLERDEWQQLAPDATRVERFFFPIYKDSPRGRALLYSGATLYQWLAGRFSVGKSRLHSIPEVTEAFPGLNPKRSLRCGQLL